MDQQHINFKQQRNFGQVLNATFGFIRQNIGKLGKALLFFAGPFLLLQGIALVYYESNVVSLTNVLRTYGLGAILTEFFFYFSILMVAALLSNMVILLTIYGYTKLYIEKGKDGFSLEEVWKFILKNFFKILGATILGGLVIGVGAVMCVIPGIYLWVSLSLMTIVILFEDMSIGESFSRSFKLTHYHWWWIVLLILVVYLIITLVSLPFTIPQAIVSLIYRLNSIHLNNEEPETIKYLMITFTILSSFVRSLMVGIFYIALTFEYFSIVEQKENPSLLQKIEEIKN
jgi:hypothetical protein